MNPLFLLVAIPDPEPLALPAPPWFLWVLLLFTFTLHVIAMNIVLGGSIILAMARLNGSPNELRLAKNFGKMMPTLVAATVTLGVAPLLFLQALYGRLFFPSAVLIAWFWLAIVPAVILAYYGTYWIAFRDGRRPARRPFAIVSLVVALLFIGVAFIQSTNMTLMLHPEQFLGRFLTDAGGTQLNSSDPTFLPRYLHMLLGALAVGGYFVALYGLTKRTEDEEHGRWAMRWGALWFVAPTALNLIAGLWWIGVLPREVILRFMGRDALASLGLGIGIILGFVTLGMMLMAVGSADPSRLVRNAGWTLAGTIATMVIARDGVRQGMLTEAKFVQTTLIDPQWGVIALFLVLLLAGLGATWWMVRLLMRSKPA